METALYYRPDSKLINDKASGEAVTHTDQLDAWIARHMPDLAADLAGMTPADSRARLSALTGAQVRSCDTIEDGSARFLAALQDLTGQP